MKMFRKDGSKFVIFTLVILMFFCDKTSSECHKLTPCSCVFPDGQGYNLTKLSTLGPLTAPAPADPKNRTIYFHPCSNEPMANPNSECHKGKGVSVCLVDPNNNYTISLGTVEETTLNVYEDTTKHPSLTVHHGNYTTSIGFVCCNICNTHLIADSAVSNTDYKLLLVSPYVCKELIRTYGLSTGSLLLIFFFVITGIYFIGGAITLKLLRGATGWEMIPNHKFWRDLPSLVRDGIDYTFNGCHVSSYQRIGA
ncbi:uncharacterized protein LOC116425928 [Nomia melanderi]|uniref:uncharacterized protein LOC116425928 n=1 Tax=Nomia melanderi TaxID=2448451 RepID=UPI0013042B2C|nr:uncharacterized protein LOC116425928 [Nomia melanderi]